MQTVTKIETIRIYPPKIFIEPVEEPIFPEIPEIMDTGQLLDWLWLRGDLYKKAWQESEIGKQKIRDWMSEETQ